MSELCGHSKSLGMTERAIILHSRMTLHAELAFWQRITDFPHMRVCSAGMAFYAGDIGPLYMVAMVYLDVPGAGFDPIQTMTAAPLT